MSWDPQQQRGCWRYSIQCCLQCSAQLLGLVVTRWYERHLGDDTCGTLVADFDLHFCADFEVALGNVRHANVLLQPVHTFVPVSR